jgi:hypothetical protein
VSAQRAVYGTGTIKRERRTKAQIAQLDQQIVVEVEEDHPQSVRHVFYRMTNPRLSEPVEKSEKGYRHTQDRCKKLRRSGKLPYSWITDATRRGYFVSTYQDAGEFLRDMAGLYRADLWKSSEYYCEVWTESRSLAGVIEDDCRELAVSLYPAGGFASISLCYQAAESIEEYSEGKPVIIFYIGDYDPAGVLIDVSIEKELREHLDPAIDLDFRRLAITPEQIERYDLPTKPRKPSDRRMLHIEETVEAEAMPAGTLREMLRDEIEKLLPQGALETVKIAEESEREFLSGTLAQYCDKARKKKGR